MNDKRDRIILYSDIEREQFARLIAFRMLGEGDADILYYPIYEWLGCNYPQIRIRSLVWFLSKNFALRKDLLEIEEANHEM